MTEGDPEQRAPADQQRKGQRQCLHRVLSPVLERARPHVADEKPQHRSAQHVGGKVGPAHHARHADEEGGAVPESLPCGKIARQHRGHGKRRRGMPGRKCIKPPLPRRAVFKGVLVRPPRAGPPDEVLQDLDSDSRQAMRHEPIESGLLPRLVLPEIADAPQPDAQEHQREPVPQPVADGSQLRDERIVQGPDQ